MKNLILKIFENAGEKLAFQKEEKTENKHIYYFNYESFKSLNKLNLIIKSLREAVKPYKINYDINNNLILKIEIVNNFKQIYYLSSYIKDAPKNQNYLLLGINENGAPVYERIENIKSLLIAGSSGSGKSSAIHSLILSGLLLNNHLYFYLIDLKATELNIYNNLIKSNRICEHVANDEKSALKIIIKFYLLIKKRFKKMMRAGLRFSDEAPAVLVIDEYAQLFNDNKTKKIINNYIAKIGALGRASNCYLILATQHPTNENINNTIRANLQSRCALRCLSPQQSNNIINSTEATKLNAPGEAIIRIDGKQPQKIKTCFVSDKFLNAVIKANS